ncbi:MAG: DUF1153 domain-containing protein [Proteobacteria bacterium]|nr:DUF1153 domain-containing protein [Pseudomonadota bacterium]
MASPTNHTLADLTPSTGRWTVRLKAEVVEAIRAGRVTAQDVMDHFGIAPEELAGWSRRYAAGGRSSLRVTRLQDVRAREAGLREAAHG